jgi:predicted PurR-regulated permease PerM
MNERKGFLLLVIGLLIVVAALMVKPFLAYVLGAVILAFVLHPLHQKIEPYTGERLSAMLMVIMSIVVAVIPVIMATGFVIEDARNVASEFSSIDAVNVTEIEASIEQYTGQQVDIEQNLRNAVESFVSLTLGNFSEVLGVVMNFLIGISLMLFLMYYLIKDGLDALEWIKPVIPMPNDISDSLFSRVNRTTWAVIKGHVLVAVIQGLVAGLGLFLAGVPDYFFWTFMMVVLGFLPLIGSMVVWGPAAIYLLMMNRVGAAVFLAIYGAIVVGLTDNFLRPLLVDEDAGLHPATILIGVIGGVYLLGAPGLFLGPILLGILKSTLLVFKNNYEDL